MTKNILIIYIVQMVSRFVFSCHSLTELKRKCRRCFISSRYSLSFRFFVGSLLVLVKWTINTIQSLTLNPIEELAIRLLFSQRSRTHFQSFLLCR